ncbi:hypothetical protein KPH14_002225 [Odynerus spinipes]|uniref:Uncharacterized protein n=1 Tax=Odynerus spinipes TaxID=1348599 RepID=A0AAD9RL30_9HYME|nr:hypothetical protein KPH14_002225 [Odynerus spinipes]
MFNLKRIVLFLCIASGLTLSVNNETKTDGVFENIYSNLKNSNTSTTVIQTNAGQVILTTTVPSATTKDLKAKDANLLQTEGGPVLNPPSVQLPISHQKINVTNDSAVTLKDIPKGKNVTETMTKSPILDRKRGDLKLDQTTVNDEKQSVETHVTTEDDHVNDHVNINNSGDKNVTTKIDDKNTQINKTSVALPVPIAAEKKLSNNTTSVVPPPSKHKPNPKPTVTMGGGAADPNKPIPPSPTKSSPLGIPRKIDYIIPIAITVVALPILGVTTFILYNRGKDCWDKRHYRRMDFLIDGMYND